MSSVAELTPYLLAELSDLNSEHRNETLVASRKVEELHDWLVSKRQVRGSRLGDHGLWMYKSEPPVSFDPMKRIITLADGKQYLLKRETVCKALLLHKTAEKFLATLSQK